MKNMQQKKLLSTAALAPFIALMASTAVAQTDDSTEAVSEHIEEIVTLGTRVKGRSATDTAVPVDVINVESIRQNGFTEFGPMLQALAPSFNFSRTQISDGSDLFRPATLRGLGPDQVLVLVNGKRRHQRSLLGLSGTVGEGATGTDFNAIPTAGIKRVEILRDGAAAQYGSDAIAGVINVELQDSVDEFFLSAQVGQTYAGDGESYQFQGNGGFSLGDSGFINFTAEYRNGEPTNRADISPFFGDRRFQMGESDTEGYMLWYNMAAPISDSVEIYSFGGYSYNEALGAGFYRFTNNPARAIPQAFPEGFLPRDLNESEDLSAAGGFRGELAGGWSWDVSAVYGKNSYDLRVEDAPNVSIAADFFNNNPGATDAEIIANVGPTSGFSGGLEFEQATFNADIAGEINDLLPDTLYVAVGAEYRDETFRITEGELDSFSCGLSPENRFIPSIVDPNTAATCGFQAFPGFRPETAGTSGRDNYAIYVDLETTFGDIWTLGAAARFEDYGDVGDKLTWKVSSRVEISEDFAVRGAIATGFRAPSLQQIGFTQVATNASAAGLTETLLAAVGTDFPGFFGIDNLGLEESDSYSAGFVWEPMDDLTVTVDAFLIQIDDRIVLGNPLRPADLDAVPDAQQFLLDRGIGQANFFSNAIDTETKGIDVVLNHTAQIAGGSLASTFAFNYNKTTVEKVTAPTGVDPAFLLPDPSEVFIERGQPRVRANANFNYEKDRWGGVLRFNYFGSTETSFFTQQDWASHLRPLMRWDLPMKIACGPVLRCWLIWNCATS
ncbi:ligand-gated channel [Iodidimonas gelatinilytica]|uniref:Ligand-gated channel n=2 Tax=Iodidimonas gelatinilytica TaxID=1236966 RepID=A0A5A7MX48_9PROT|nr:ligand-gated channel [Iodidimonas gelatinilytica]